MVSWISGNPQEITLFFDIAKLQPWSCPQRMVLVLRNSNEFGLNGKSWTASSRGFCREAVFRGWFWEWKIPEFSNFWSITYFLLHVELFSLNLSPLPFYDGISIMVLINIEDRWAGDSFLIIAQGEYVLFGCDQQRDQCLHWLRLVCIPHHAIINKNHSEIWLHFSIRSEVTQNYFKVTKINRKWKKYKVYHISTKQKGGRGSQYSHKTEREKGTWSGVNGRSRMRGKEAHNDISFFWQCKKKSNERWILIINLNNFYVFWNCVPSHLITPLKLYPSQNKKRNKTKQNKTKQNKTKQNKTKRNETKQNETKQNETKQNKTNKLYPPSPSPALLPNSSKVREPTNRTKEISLRTKKQPNNHEWIINPHILRNFLHFTPLPPILTP